MFYPLSFTIFENEYESIGFFNQYTGTTAFLIQCFEWSFRMLNFCFLEHMFERGQWFDLPGPWSDTSSVKKTASLSTGSEKVWARNRCQWSLLRFRRYLTTVVLIFFFVLSADHLVICGGCGTGGTWHFCHMEQNLVLNSFFCASESAYLHWKE